MSHHHKSKKEEDATPMIIPIDALTLSPQEQRDRNNLILSLDSIPPDSPALVRSPEAQHRGGDRLEDFDPEEEDRKAQDLKNEEIAISGYLYKRTDSGGNWKKRWMVLYKGGPIFYYEDLRSEDPSGALYLNNAAVFEKIQFNGFVDPKSFGVRVDGKDFLLKAKSEEQKLAWCSAIDQNIVMTVEPKKKGGKSERTKRQPVSGSFYSAGNEPSDDEINPRKPAVRSSSSDDDSDTDDDDETEEDASEGEIADDEIVMEGSLDILKDAAKQLWNRRHLILESNGSLYIYREQSDFPCDLINVLESTLYTRVEKRQINLDDCFNLSFNRKNYIIRAGPEKQAWVDALKKMIPVKERRNSNFTELEVLKEQNRRLSVYEELEVSQGSPIIS